MGLGVGIGWIALAVVAVLGVCLIADRQYTVRPPTDVWQDGKRDNDDD